jgi:AraC-like DNA-binding protein
MDMMTADAVADIEPVRSGRLDAQGHADALDRLGDELVIASRSDAEALGDLLSAVDGEMIFFAITRHRSTNQLVLVVADGEAFRACSRDLVDRAIISWGASRRWLEDAADGAPGIPVPGFSTGSYFLDADTTRLAAAARASTMKGRVGTLYRLAKCQELVCSAVSQYLSRDLVPVASGGLSIEDTRRLMEACQLIATRFAEKLTLRSIARACGLNRTKLAWGFRQLFDCSIAEALSEKRLTWASSELTQGTMSISQIAYSAGYLSHASFTRAFARHYGVSPRQWRRLEKADGVQSEPTGAAP